jgi:DNA-binding NtrC family response regulator
MARVLIIDDDELFRGFLKQALTRAGHDTVEAGDGDEGLAHFRSQKMDVVITDIILPGKNGLEAIAEMKMESPDVKIIAVTGGDMAMPKGYVSYKFSKPVYPKPLISAVESLCT